MLCRPARCLPLIFREGKSEASLDEFPPQELVRIRELWDFFDLDGDHAISREDMKFGLSMLAENFLAVDSVSQGIANQYLQRKIKEAMKILETAGGRARSAAGERDRHRGTRSANNNAEEDGGHSGAGGLTTPRGEAMAASPRPGGPATADGKAPASGGKDGALAGALSPGTIAMWVDADKVRVSCTWNGRPIDNGGPLLLVR